MFYTKKFSTFQLLYSALMQEQMQNECNWPIKPGLQLVCAGELPTI